MTTALLAPSATTGEVETAGIPRLPLDVPRTAHRQRAQAFLFAWSAYLFLHHSMVYYSWFRIHERGERDLTGLLIGLLVWFLGTTALVQRTVPWFIALLVGQLVYELPALPKTANHTFLTICINLTMLATIGVHALRTRGDALRDPQVFFPQLAALVRLEILVMYFFVVLHKLNTDYFNPSYSCATNLYSHIVHDYPFLPSGVWTDPLCIYGAIGCEALIPLLLLFRATRLWGVALGLLFHLMLSPHDNPFIFSFSALLYAAYFLFLPVDVLGEMLMTWNRLLARLRPRWLWFAAAGALGATTIIALRLFARELVEQVDLIDRAHLFVAAGVRMGWNLLALFNIYAFARAVWVRRGRQLHRVAGRHEARFFQPGLVTPLVIFPILVTLNGFCPYLGLKTESAFAMYANLRTEGTRNNHLFMPRINLANYQDDLVEIVDSSDRQLRELKREGYGLTWFEFRRSKLSQVRSNTFWVTFKRNGVERTLRYAEQQNVPAFAPVPWYQRRLLYFRAVQVDPTSPQYCGH
jgi:hypothetical protein